MICQDILVKILLRLPVKTVARFICVSKLWASIIRSQNFIKSYDSRSSIHEPCILFAFRDVRTIRWRFFTSQETPSNATHINMQCFKPQCVNGLIYYESGSQLLIYNSISGNIIPLPQIDPKKSILAWSLGYDPINYQYKVLSFSKDKFLYYPCRVEAEVFTLGDQGSWKMIKDTNVDHPLTSIICIGGVLYYGACTAHGAKFFRFDVRTEKFGDFIEIPVEAAHMYGLSFFTLMNYQGKLAILARKDKSFCRYDLWILEDVDKQEWFKVSIDITREMCSFDIIGPGVVGFVATTGEVIITARDYYDQLHVICVDLQKNHSREVEFQEILSSKTDVLAFTDYVKSIMFL